MFKGYVINLNRHPERLHRFNQHPDAHYFERFPAIDKKQLDIVGSPTLFFDTHKSTQNLRREITLGEIACTLSHVSVWQKIALDESITPDDFVVVAEDDVILDKEFLKHVRHLQFVLKTTAIELLILQRLLMSKAPMDCRNCEFEILDDVAFDHVGSALYMIKKSRAQNLTHWLSEYKPFWLADQFSVFCPDKHQLGLLYPMIGFVADDAESDLEDERVIARQNSSFWSSYQSQSQK